MRNEIETLIEIYETYENGNFTQARGEIAEAIENNVNLPLAIEGETNKYVGYASQRPDFIHFVWVEIAKYLASNKPSHNAKENVAFNWEAHALHINYQDQEEVA
jgi:hypothetical protein